MCEWEWRRKLTFNAISSYFKVRTSGRKCLTSVPASDPRSLTLLFQKRGERRCAPPVFGFTQNPNFQYYFVYGLVCTFSSYVCVCLVYLIRRGIHTDPRLAGKGFPANGNMKIGDAEKVCFHFSLRPRDNRQLINIWIKNNSISFHKLTDRDMPT